MVFINRLHGWDSISEDLTETLEEIAREEGLVFQILSSFNDLNDQLDPILVVVAGGDADFSDFINQFADSYFIVIAVPEVGPSRRVAVIGPEGLRMDKMAFLEGYISALITSEWRTGVIGLGSTGEGQAAMKGYINGVRFFCGLCRIKNPPFYDYPVSAYVSSPDVNSLQSGYELLASQAVETIVLTHEFKPEFVKTVISEAMSSSIYWMGPNPPAPNHREFWIATILPYPSEDIADAYRQLRSGKEDVIFPMKFVVRDVRSDVLTEGKLKLVHEVLRDLELGIIDTGIDPLTGQDR